MLTNNFKTIYWGEDKSTEVTFESTSGYSDIGLISSCVVFAVHAKTKVAITKPARGWGLPGGHIEEGESPEECIEREAQEEACITLRNLTLIGRWSAKKRFSSPHNAKYPEQAYQLLYIAEVARILPFTQDFEVSGRMFVPFHQISAYHHRFEDYKEIFDFAQNEYSKQAAS